MWDAYGVPQHDDAASQVGVEEDLPELGGMEHPTVCIHTEDRHHHQRHVVLLLLIIITGRGRLGVRSASPPLTHAAEEEDGPVAHQKDGIELPP